jgi:hypothetical protein
MEVVTNVVMNPGTDKAKLVPGDVIKLTKSDFKSAAKNISAVLGHITQPLMDFGKAVDEGSSWFSNGYIETGLDMFGKLSSSMVVLAQGVQQMANLEVIENVIINKGTKDAMIVPGNVIKLNKGHFKAAALSIKEILDNIAKPLSDFGKAVDEGSGWFGGDGYIAIGLNMFGLMSESISTLASGVASMANLEVVTNTIANKGTPDAKLVPNDVIKLAPADFTAAATNIGLLLSNITEPLTAFGKKLEGGGSSGIFAFFEDAVSPNYMQTGLQGLGTLSESLGNLAEGMQKMANFEFVENMIVNPGTPDAKIVPKATKKITPQMLKDGAANISELLGGITAPVTKFGRAMMGMDPNASAEPGFLGGLGEMFTAMVSPDYMAKGLEGIGTLSQSLGTLAEGMQKMADMEFIPNTVFGIGTKDAKIVPGAPVKITKEMMKASAENLGALLTNITGPLTTFGRAMEGMEGQDGGGGFWGGLWETFTAAVSPKYMKIGLEGLGTLTESLGGLAEGVQRMANLEVVTQKVVDDGKGGTKVVPGDIRKLNFIDFILAGLNIDMILGMVTEPLTNFGKAMEEGSGWFSDGYVKKGLEGLGLLSESIGGLADGVIKMASMQVVQQKIVGEGKDAKLVPDKIITLNDTHFTLAAEGIATILNGLSGPLGEFGKAYDSGGTFYGLVFGDVKAGIEAMAAVSEPISALADGIIKMSSGEVVQQTISTDKKGNPKLVPGKVLNFTEMVADAKTNLADILTFFPTELANAGKFMRENEFHIESVILFLEQDILPSMELMTEIGTEYSKTSQAVMALRSKYPELYEEEKAGQAPFMWPVATYLGYTPLFSMYSGDLTEAHAQLAVNIVPSLELIVEASELYGEATHTFNEAWKLNVPMDQLILSLDTSMSTLGQTMKRDMDKTALSHLIVFNNQMTRLANIVSPFERFTKAFTQFAKDMGTFGKNFSVMTPEGIDAYKTWTDAVVTVAKTDFSAIESKLSAMRDIAASIYKAGDNEIPNKDDEQSVPDKKKAIANKDKNVVSSPDKGSPAGEGGGGGGKGDGAAIAAAIKSALSNITIAKMTVQELKTSDRRLKNNIKLIGVSPLGINIYEYNYIWDSNTKFIGVMAQELLGTEWAHAVVLDENNYYAVNYSEIDVDFCLADEYIQYENDKI